MKIVSIYAPRRDHPQWLDYVPLLRLQKASCTRFDCQQIVITDEPGADELAPEFEVYVDQRMPHSLMPAILHGLWSYVADSPIEPFVLCGADGLLCQDPRTVFADHGFDMAFTTHPFRDCILNMGAQFIASPVVAEPFYRAAVDRCGERWGDDQTAFASTLNPTLQHGDYLRDSPTGDGVARVRFLPVPGYNDAPEDAGDPRGLPVIAHFRGPRKKWMADWARQHLGIEV